MTNCLIDFFKKQDVEYTESFNFSKISAIGIGGRVRLVAIPDSLDKLTLTVDCLLQENIKYKIIGKTTNLLMLEDFYDGVFINLKSGGLFGGAYRHWLLLDQIQACTRQQ